MAGYRKTKQSLAEYSLAPKKRFGQNFLVHRKTAEAIVAAGAVGKEDIVVEVGVGLAALTIPLAEAAGHVFGLEIDSGIVRYHQEENDLPDNVTLIHGDVLKADLAELSVRCRGPLKILANLPYSISNPFLFKLIENRLHMAWATVMLQKEVAERLTAPPGTKDYGVPTVLLQSCATIRQLMTLKPGEFHPRPKIDSVVVRIDFSPDNKRLQDLPAYDHKLFTKIVRAAFNQRRKTLINTLSSARLFLTGNSGEEKVMTGGVIEEAGIEAGVRAETLALEDFVRLAVAAERQLADMGRVDKAR
jgi:16S rRNA (adenine1518-N6/adenine1519-N6)-dimethyltransferase